MEYAIELSQVCKQYGALRALDAVDLQLPPGEILGLVGHNGAGKSSLFKMMLGLQAPTSGRIRLWGQTVHGEAGRRVRRHIGYLPENIVFYDKLDAVETLNFFAQLKGLAVSDQRALLERVGLGFAAKRCLREYSKGMRQRLGLAQALLGEPRLLFLDEPTSGLDPQGIREFYDLILQLRDQGVTVVLSSHHLDEIESRLDRLALMRQGRLRAVGRMASLRQSQDKPVHIEVQMRPGQPWPIEDWAGLDAQLSHQSCGDLHHLRCSLAAKLELLARLTAARATMLDIQVREASLAELVDGL